MTSRASPILRLSSRTSSKPQWTCFGCRSRQFYSQKSSASPPSREPPDHRKLGTKQGLFMNTIYSPGSPIFLPNGARIFNKLIDFLRKQYVRYGFQEVITPTIYKKELWAKSGHLENYADDMYSVTGAKSKDYAHDTPTSPLDSHNSEEGDFGLKPMNCPGHCLIFASQNRSYRDLPIRYADFSALHRNENSGSLSGLTRVRRFHQDDGHIFCRPNQVEREITRTLDFVKAVYSVLRLGVNYRMALSTRPDDHYIGEPAEWERAEAALGRALDASGMHWSINQGDGAFYGPKIDIILTDSDGKEHQTATIQLDFQLPKRFELEYQAPAPALEAKGETTTDPDLLAEYGPVRPVMIHRAVLGSVERLMAILIEKYDGKWPFWLNPRQVILLTVNTSDPVVQWAQQIQDVLLGLPEGDGKQSQDRQLDLVAFQPTGLSVEVDASARPLGAKLREAKEAGFGQILVVGEKDVERRQVTLGKESMDPSAVRDVLRSMVDLYQ